MQRVRNSNLEQRLILLSWLNDQFGYEQNRDLLADLKDSAEGFDAEGRSYIYHSLVARGDAVKISRDDLSQYDENICQHLHDMNFHRSEPIVLRYFQYLAVLYTEVFLDRYFNHREETLRSLNHFLERHTAELQDAKFSASDLKKLAFWMATGSGKTLIMHINYRQFLHYNNLPLDNILLITPNEGLSEQHLDEMAASNVPCQRFELNESGLLMTTKDAVKVIEITKLVEQKRGGGVSVPVEAFEGNNLIFVDEGHKGSGGEAWRYFRDTLGETGFTFEYSATFGQALAASGKDALTEEYGKAIVFDYSYRYFHGDGYGKDFRVLNLKDETTEKQTEMLLMGNLLSFYEQQCVFEEQAEALRPYNLEQPLWVFVGGTVNAVYTKNRQKRSDVLTVARFLHHVLENKGGWAVSAIKKLMQGETGLITASGRDVFEKKFTYLRQNNLSPDEVYRDILAKIFHSRASGGLHLCGIRSADGELGLKASGAENYFGLIYIGDTSTFKKLVEEDDSGMMLEEDAIVGSLFDDINEPDTNINVLIGAKKFMEGWNSWRVSNMGLLNIGRSEGSEIIQLFGRGVRLRGKDFSLKRSVVLDLSSGQADDTLLGHIGLLETLNIFAVRANYMSQFRQYLEKEGVETEEMVELPLSIRINKNFLEKGLVVPRVPDGRDFAAEEDIVLVPDPSVQVHVDMSLKVQTLESRGAGIVATDAQLGDAEPIPDKSLKLVDWEKAYFDLIDYKERKGFGNLIVQSDVPKRILTYTEPKSLYRLVADESVVKPQSFGDAARLQEVVTNILRKYMEAFYRSRRERWESSYLVYKTLHESDPNLSFNHSDEVKDDDYAGRYMINVQQSESELISEIQKFINDFDQLCEEEIEELPRIYFDRHLYHPLLKAHRDEIRLSPLGLNDSESQFVQDLQNFWASEKDELLAGTEVFLLRNLERGRGVGFFEERGFYPDFILWIIADQQHIVFLEPHGMLHANAYRHDDKARLHERLPELAKEIGMRSNRQDVTLDSYIISATPYEDLYQRYGGGSWDIERFAGKHILFCEQDDYMKRIFEEQLAQV